MPPSPPPGVPPSNRLPAPGGSNYAFNDPSSSGFILPGGASSHYSGPGAHGSLGGSSRTPNHQAMTVLEQLRRRSDSSYEGNPACDNCRRRKTKCDRQQPVCGRCAKLGRKCTRSDVLMRRGPPSNKERAAYQAAGIEIPSLKYRHRTRRAQSLASANQPPHHSRLQPPGCAFHSSFSQAGLSSSNQPAFRPGIPGSSNMHMYTNAGTFSDLQGHSTDNTVGNAPLARPAFHQPFPPNQLDPAELAQERSSVDFSRRWENNNNSRRSYYGFDESATAPPTFRSGYSPVVSATSSEPSQRRWTMLPHTSTFGQSTEQQVIPESGHAQLAKNQFDQRDSLSSNASISPIQLRPEITTRTPANRFPNDYLNPSYHPNRLPFASNSPSQVPQSQIFNSSPSSANSGSFVPPTLGHEPLATGMVAPTADEQAYGRPGHPNDYEPNYSSMRSLPASSFPSDVGTMSMPGQGTYSSGYGPTPSQQPMLFDYALSNFALQGAQSSAFAPAPYTWSAHGSHSRAQQGQRELSGQDPSLVAPTSGPLDSTDPSTLGQDPRFSH